MLLHHIICLGELVAGDVACLRIELLCLMVVNLYLGQLAEAVFACSSVGCLRLAQRLLQRFELPWLSWPGLCSLRAMGQGRPGVVRMYAVLM